MKRTHLLAATIAAAIALAPVLAEDTTKPEASDQTQEQKDCCKGMTGMMGKEKGNIDMGNMAHRYFLWVTQVDSGRVALRYACSRLNPSRLRSTLGR